MASRWEHLFETKPVPLIEHLLEEVAKLLAKDLQQWPPPVQELDLEVGGQYAALFTEPPPRPARAVYDEALRLSRWELAREHDAYDEYMRNKRYLERGLVQADRLPLLFLNRWMVDQMLGLGEATGGRVNRRHMLQCLERLEARMRSLQTSFP